MKLINCKNVTTLFYPVDGSGMWVKEEITSEAHTQNIEKCGKIFEAFGLIRRDKNRVIAIPVSMSALNKMSGNSLMAYFLGRNLIQLQGMELERSLEGFGAFSGHDLLSLQKPNSSLGIKYPSDYKILKPVSLLSDAVMNSTRNLELLLAGLFIQVRDSYSPDAYKILGSLNNPSSMREASELLEMSRGVLTAEQKEEMEPEDVISVQQFKRLHKSFMNIWMDWEIGNKKCETIGKLIYSNSKPHETNLVDKSGLGGSRQFIPQLDWFPEDLRENCTPEMILSIFPKAEREVFELFLGRTVAGREGQRYTDQSTQSKKWRCLPVLFGEQGGLGKSTLNEFLCETLQYLGYSVGKLPPDLTARFGFGDAARSHFAYVDDTQEDKLPGMLTNQHLKSLISGTPGFVYEDKGEKHNVVPFPACAMMILTNKFPVHKMELDGGNTSRIAVMRLYNEDDEQATNYREKYDLPIRIDQAIKKVAERFSVSVNTLMAWLLRVCFDRFESLVDNDQIRDFIETRKENEFRMRLDNSHEKMLMLHYLTILSRCGSIPNAFEPEKFMRTIWFSLHNHSDTNPIQYPWSHVIPQCSIPREQLSVLLFQTLKGSGNIKTKFREFMDGLISDSGNNYKTYINHWTDLFHSCKNKLKNYSEDYNISDKDQLKIAEYTLERKYRADIEYAKENGYPEPKKMELNLETFNWDKVRSPECSVFEMSRYSMVM